MKPVSSFFSVSWLINGGHPALFGKKACLHMWEQVTKSVLCYPIHSLTCFELMCSADHSSATVESCHSLAANWESRGPHNLWPPDENTLGGRKERQGMECYFDLVIALFSGWLDISDSQNKLTSAHFNGIILEAVAAD